MTAHPSSRRSWRIVPSSYLESQIETLARRENRSLSNMLARLLSEALEHRRAASNEISTLVQMIRGAPAHQEEQAS
jgi:hypothetical protein